MGYFSSSFTAEFDARADKVRLTDELGEDRAAGLVLNDGADDVFLRARLGVDAEEFGEEVVRSAVVRHDAHEGQVGDVLHRGQRGQRQAGADTGRQVRGARCEG